MKRVAQTLHIVSRGDFIVFLQMAFFFFFFWILVVGILWMEERMVETKRDNEQV